MDITKHSILELQDLLLQIPIELQARETQARAKAIEEMEKVAQAHGYTVDDLLRNKSAAAKVRRAPGGVKVPKNPAKESSTPKYCMPGDPSKTWTGRGRNPVWVEQHLASGGTLESLLIAPPAQ